MKKIYLVMAMALMAMGASAKGIVNDSVVTTTPKDTAACCAKDSASNDSTANPVFKPVEASEIPDKVKAAALKIYGTSETEKAFKTEYQGKVYYKLYLKGESEATDKPKSVIFREDGVEVK